MVRSPACGAAAAAAARLLRALGDGNMRWSVRQRPDYAQASRLCFMITQGRVPEEGESFELLFQKAFPGRPLISGGRQRRRRRRRPASTQ